MESTMSITESLMSMITPSVVSSASQYFGESASSTERGLTAAMASTLAGTSRLAASDGGMGLSSLMKEHAVSDGVLGNLGGAFTRSGNGSSLLSSGQQVAGQLFGSRTGEIASSLESFAGVKGATASGMLALAGPMVLGFLSRHQRSQSLSSAALASQLTSERSSLTRYLPPGIATLMGTAAPLGAGEPIGATTASTSTRAAPHMLGVTSGVATTHYGGPHNRWILPLAVLAGLIALGAWFTMRTTPRVARVAVPTVTHFASVRLPNGSSIAVPPSSLNYNLATFLDKGSPSDLPRTFVFDHLNFMPGSTELTADSTPTVTQLASILRAYPNATIALVGYTDSTGDPESNRKLSLDRANTVRDQLVSAGVDPAHISTEGYGQDRPVASNDTEQGRARNRRTELRLASK
jgi:OmpA-OmpF porin, OOP family